MRNHALFLALLICASTLVVAQDLDSLPNPSVMPDNSWYGLKIGWEDFSQAMLHWTSKSKVEYAFERARLRMAEANAMRGKNLTERAELAELRGIGHLGYAKMKLENVNDDAVVENLRDKARKNVEVINALILSRGLNESVGLKNAMEQFEKQAVRRSGDIKMLNEARERQKVMK